MQYSFCNFMYFLILVQLAAIWYVLIMRLSNKTSSFVLSDMEIILNVPEGSSSLNIKKHFNTDHVLGKIISNTRSTSF